MDALLTGVVAGYGIAIAVLIVEVGIRCGFRCAAAAGAGAATADLPYAGLAVIGGAALAGVAESVDRPLRIVSSAVLVVIAVVGLRRVGRTRESVEFSSPDRRELAGTYARFVALTIINPTTIIYFAAVIVGLGVADDLSAAEGVLFAVGAFLASLVLADVPRRCWRDRWGSAQRSRADGGDRDRQSGHPRLRDRHPVSMTS